MGLLDKNNPRATRRSAAAWAVGGGLVGGLVGWYSCSRPDMPASAAWFIVPCMVAGCAVSGWAMEWQLPWDSDEEAEPGAAADGPRHSFLETTAHTGGGRC